MIYHWRGELWAQQTCDAETEEEAKAIILARLTPKDLAVWTEA